MGYFSFRCWKEGISKRTKSAVENSTSFPGEMLRRKTRGCALCAVVRAQIMQIQFSSAHLQWLLWTSSIKSSPKWDTEVANICRILFTFQHKYIYLMGKYIELQILIILDIFVKYSSHLSLKTEICLMRETLQGRAAEKRSKWRIKRGSRREKDLLCWKGELKQNNSKSLVSLLSFVSLVPQKYLTNLFVRHHWHSRDTCTTEKFHQLT